MSHLVLVVDDEPALARALAINLRGARLGGRRPPRTAAVLSRPPPSGTPTSCSSTSGCPTWTAPR